MVAFGRNLDLVNANAWEAGLQGLRLRGASGGPTAAQPGLKTTI